MKTKRSVIEFPLWRKKVDTSLFKNAAMHISNWLWQALDIEKMSNSSTCTTSIFNPPNVLKAKDWNNNETFTSIRFSMGKFKTKKEVKSVVQLLLTLFGVINSINDVN